MEASRTTIAAVAIACASAGAVGAWLLLDGRGGESPPAAVAWVGHPLPSALEPLEPPPVRADRAEPAMRPAITLAAVTPTWAAPPAPRVAVPAAPASTPAPDEPANETDGRADAPFTVPGLDRIREIPSGAPPEVRADERQVESLRVEFEELVVGAESVIGLRLEAAVSSTTAQVEDPVEAVVTRDVLVGGRVAVAAGTRARGFVTLVEHGGRLRDPARLRIRFSELTLPDGTRLEIDSNPIIREGDAPGDESAAAIGGSAIGGAILGGILGGARGVLIGGTAGAGAGAAVAMATGPDPAVLAAGTQVTIRLLRPLAVMVER